MLEPLFENFTNRASYETPEPPSGLYTHISHAY